jgi:DNA topoisomerase-1
LQQESSRKLRFSVKRTMMLAQRLYEGVEIGKEGAVGLITYMRTDSTRVSDDAMPTRALHRRALRPGVPAGFAPNIYKGKKDAQDAHEAIRPTSMAYAPEVVEKYLAEDEMKLYRLIWNRFVASPDDAGAVRPDHHRRRRQGQERRGLPVPRHRRCSSSTAS